MLLEFIFSNFKSFKNKTTLSMVPAPKIKDLDYSVLRCGINKKQYKGLAAAVIYGPNAAGKTNIISAMEVFKSIVIRGNIENGDYVFVSANEAVKKMELIPNINCEAPEPVCFMIRFIEKDMLFEYSISADLGLFLNSGYDRRIVNEYLKVNEELIYERNGSQLTVKNINTISNQLISEFAESISDKIAQNNLNDKELFLTGMFKTLYSSKIVKTIVDWLSSRFKVYLRVNIMITEPDIESNVKGMAYVDKTLNEAVRLFGIHGNDVAYMKLNDNQNLVPYSILPNNKAVPVNIFESYGTERFLNIFPIIVETLRTGSTLIVDEFDASIHPMALMSIIGAFHNDEINTKNAQLIFNTHNPIFLNRNLFRRDEIKFVDRDDDTGISMHYSLSDFGTSGPNGVRNTEDYMKNYFISQYGSIRNIDFSDILKEKMESSRDETE